MKVDVHPEGTNIYGGLVNSLMAQVIPVPNSTDWAASIWTGHTNSGWETSAFSTRMQATVYARQRLGLLPAR